MASVDDHFSLYERTLRKLGVELIRRGGSHKYLRLPSDFQDDHHRIYRQVEPYTMTRPPRVYALIEAVKYVVRNEVPGAFVECGVWRGGSIMAMALTLLDLEARRDVYLFDTFAGMSAPTEEDWNEKEGSASRKFAKTRLSDDSSDWCRSDLDSVKQNVFSTGYDRDLFHFVQGKVEDTLPTRAPEQIALLRLDTDFYTSTKHELLHLYPRVSPGGVIILDDYGHWHGARQAVDEYLENHGIHLLLNRVDFASRLALKP